MTIEIVAATIGILDDERRQIIEALRKIARASLSSLSGEETKFLGDIKDFIRWQEDPRALFSDDEDKFADLIGLSSKHPDISTFFITEVGVNMSTVWRWANGKSRPTRYVGRKLSQEVASKLAWILYEGALDRGLLDKALAD